MKKFVFLIIGFCLLSCEKESKVIQDGSYSGYFKYGPAQLWESIGIENGNFIEYASGGVASQKFPIYCLTKGTYKIRSGIIEFDQIQVAEPPNRELGACDQEFLLMGSYNIDELNDSTISFWKNSSLGKQEYKLKLYHSK